MKFNLIKCLVILASSFSFVFATVSVGIANNLDGNQPLSSPDNPSGIPTGSIWQLIWSPVNSIAAFDHSNPLLMNGNEVLLDQFNGDGQTESNFLNAAGGAFSMDNKNYDSSLSPYNLDDAFSSGKVYVRVFDFQGSGTPGIGTWFDETSLFAVNSQDPTPNTPTTVSFSGPVLMSQQIIPEPTTLMALLVGIVGLLGFRRHLQKK